MQRHHPRYTLVPSPGPRGLLLERVFGGRSSTSGRLNAERNASQPRTLQWSPVAWLSCLSTLGWVMAFTTGEWQSWFCMYLGLPLPSMCALSTNNRRCPCRRTYDVNGDHILTCCHHKANWTRCHNHILACLVSLFRQAGFQAGTKGSLGISALRISIMWQTCIPSTCALDIFEESPWTSPPS